MKKLLAIFTASSLIFWSTGAAALTHTPAARAIASVPNFVVIPSLYLDLLVASPTINEEVLVKSQQFKQYLLNLAKQGVYPVVPNEYIVVLKSEVNNIAGVAQNINQNFGVKINQLYITGDHGFAATLSANQYLVLINDSRVKYITPVTVQFIQDIPEPCNNSGCLPSPQVETISTGARRIGDEQNRFSGRGVTIAGIDTGINMNHPDLAANISSDLRRNCLVGANPTNAFDDHGHGSHTAGIMAAAHNNMGVRGVAYNATLVPVKVLNALGWGTTSTVICGMDYVTQNANRIQVANMSLGGYWMVVNDNCQNTSQDPEYAAACAMERAGVILVVAAGNNGLDLIRPLTDPENSWNVIRPGAYDSVITATALSDSDGRPGGLGAVTSIRDVDDRTAYYTNFSSCQRSIGPNCPWIKRVIKAPGTDILSTTLRSRYGLMSGTSMAAPYVSGAVALLLEKWHRLNLPRPANPRLAAEDALLGVGPDSMAPEAVGNGNTDPLGTNPEPLLNLRNLR